jgi:hypothetical protein
MAGDWMPMQLDLAKQRETLLVATKLKLRPRFTVGLLHSFWAWASSVTADGFVPGVTAEMIDRDVVEFRGFASAIASDAVGWLILEPDGVRIPNFDRWLSSGAKARMGETIRKRLQRAGVSPPECPDKQAKCPDTSGTSVRTKVRTTEQAEQRTEEKTKTGPPLSEDTRKPRAPLRTPEQSPDRVIDLSDLPACLPELPVRAVLHNLGVDEPARTRLVEAGATVAVIQEAHRAAQQGDPRRWRSVMVADLLDRYGLRKKAGGPVRGLAASVAMMTPEALAASDDEHAARVKRILARSQLGPR